MAATGRRERGGGASYLANGMYDKPYQTTAANCTQTKMMTSPILGSSSVTSGRILWTNRVWVTGECQWWARAWCGGVGWGLHLFKGRAVSLNVLTSAAEFDMHARVRFDSH